MKAKRDSDWGGVSFSEGFELPARGRPKKTARKTNAASARDRRARMTEKRETLIGVIDSETPPFGGSEPIYPFLFVIHTDEFEPIVLWDENFPRLIKKLAAALDAIPEPYTFYAHNGGKFDYMFMLSEIRGEVSFKGRGIMDGKIGKHRIRDSFHIIPERLANYHKEEFDYQLLKKGVRSRPDVKKKTIAYCLSDCVYLLDIVKKFIGEFGLKLSIGQAAIGELKKHYEWQTLTPGWDEYLRSYFFGGRVECLRGRGDFRGAYRLYDVNSMYPHVMARFKHPIGGMADYKMRTGKPGRYTVFIDLECDNAGALICRTAEGETTASVKHGNFYTTIHEYRVALKHGLIKNVRINFCLDCKPQTNFEKFVLPLYGRRQLTKKVLADFKARKQLSGPEYLNAVSKDMFLKFLLNNAYGKFAQNPRDFKEHYITDPGDSPPDKWFKTLNRLPDGERDAYMQPAFECDAYWIYSKPAPGFRFNNVGTAASITGAARAVLLDALQHAVDAIYCDTDSIICRELHGVEIDKEKLGAWDIEKEFSRVIINGKKLYSCEEKAPNGQRGQIIIKSKGTVGLTQEHMEMMLDGHSTPMTNFGPTLTRYGGQEYLTREIRATTPFI